MFWNKNQTFYSKWRDRRVNGEIVQTIKLKQQEIKSISLSLNQVAKFKANYPNYLQ